MQGYDAWHNEGLNDPYRDSGREPMTAQRASQVVDELMKMTLELSKFAQVRVVWRTFTSDEELLVVEELLRRVDSPVWARRRGAVVSVLAQNTNFSAEWFR